MYYCYIIFSLVRTFPVLGGTERKRLVNIANTKVSIAHKLYMAKYGNNFGMMMKNIFILNWGEMVKKNTLATPGARALIVNSDHLQFPFSFVAGLDPFDLLSERPDGKRLHRERKYEQGPRAHHWFCTDTSCIWRAGANPVT